MARNVLQLIPSICQSKTLMKIQLLTYDLSIQARFIICFNILYFQRPLSTKLMMKCIQDVLITNVSFMRYSLYRLHNKRKNVTICFLIQENQQYNVPYQHLLIGSIASWSVPEEMHYWWELEAQASSLWPDWQLLFLALRCSRSLSPKITEFKN